MYNSHANRIPHQKEMNDGKSDVETAGFIPKNRKIQIMLTAGKRLEDMRKAGVFDFMPGVEPDLYVQVDPTRSKAFDLADASAILRNLQDRSLSVQRDLEEMKKKVDEGKLSDEVVKKAEEKETTKA